VSRKDYVRFTEMLASHGDYRAWSKESPQFVRGYEAARQDIGRSVAALLKLENPRFDPVRFFEAAQL